MNTAYNETLLHYAFNVSRRGSLSSFNATGSARSRLCGSKIEVTLLIHNGIVHDFAQQVNACSFGAAAASIIAKDICGSEINEVRAATQKLRQIVTGTAISNSPASKAIGDAMVSEDPHPDTPDNTSSKWSDLDSLAAIVEWPSRIPSALLIANALEEAFSKYDQTNQQNLTSL